MSSESIPLIDVGPLVASDPETHPDRWQKTVGEIDAALRDFGFLYVKNHGVPDKLQSRLFELSRKFFAEDLNRKMEISMDKAGKAWRGYFPVGGELTSGKPDKKEGIYFGRELDGTHEDVVKGLPLHGANQWPRGNAYGDFKTSVMAYMSLLSDLGQILMAAVGLGLGLPSDYFRSRFTHEPTTLFRIFNYPKHVWAADQDEWGVREHTDMGFLTILLQDDSGGLQVRSKNGNWIAAPPMDGTFVVNIGDMLEVWTHGIYRATPHRVRNTGAGDRLSMPFFFDPHWKSTLEPIETGRLSPERLAQVSQSTRQRWDGLDLRKLSRDMTYGDFVWSKVKKVFPQLGGKTD